MKRKATLFLVLSVLIGIMFLICGISLATTPETSGEVNAANIFLTMFMLLLSVIFFTKYKKYSNPEKLKEEKKLKDQKLELKKEENKAKIESFKKRPGSITRIKELGAKLCFSANHVAGLPIAEGTPCHIYLCDDKIIFERNEMKYNLSLEKISDVIINTDTEIHKAYVSSAGGAVGGAMIFGPLGAIVGGRAKEKKSKTVTEFLIFSYDKDGDTEYISFDVTKVPQAKNLVYFFNKIMVKEAKEIEL